MTKKLLAAIMVAFGLVGCGGGGSGVPEVPVAQAPLPVVVSDVTFTQVNTVEVVTPGETFRPVLIEVTCPLMVGTQSCMKTLPLGEIGFTSDLALQEVKLLHDGIEMAGFFNQEGSLYRFTPTGYSPIWQPGVIEVVATLLPTASDGAKTVVVVQAADASIDKTLSVVSGEAKVTVKSLPYNAPAIVAPLKDGNGFSYSCPDTVSDGCRLDNFTWVINGAAPSSEVQLNVGGISWGQFWADSNGYLPIITFASYTVPSGGTVVVRVLPALGSLGTASLWFQNIKSWSGDKMIAPLLPSDCTIVSSQHCKG